MQIIISLSKILFAFLKIFPVKKNRIVMECDYGKGFYGNLYYIYEYLNSKAHSYEIIIPLNKKVDKPKMKIFNTKFVKTRTIKHLYYLATAKFWVTNNHYYYFLKPSKKTIFINTWHSLSGIKKIGVEATRNTQKIANYAKEGKNIDYFLVGSDDLKMRFHKSLKIDYEKMLNIGLPRTDPFFDRNTQSNKLKDFYKRYPNLENKIIYLYLPTFRDDSIKNFELPIDLELWSQEMDQEKFLIIKLHSIIKETFQLPDKYKKFCLVINDEDVNTLMFASDYLITDYSSVFFEYALLEKPIIFYPYDYKDYVNNRGIIENYFEFIPGPWVLTTKELINFLKFHNFDISKVTKFAELHNDFKDGNSSKRFVEEFFLK